MKLNEIRLIKNGHRTQRYNISDFDTENGTAIGNSEGGTILVQAKCVRDQHAVLIALYDKNKENLLSGIIGYFFNFNGDEYFKVIDVFTPVPFRSKGYATSLYTTLVRKYQVKLMSDNEQTEDGKRLWAGISKILNVQVLDASNKTIIPKNSVSDEDIYINEPDRYLLVAEHIVTGIDLIGIPLVGDGIVESRRFYTHKDNVGLYE